MYRSIKFLLLILSISFFLSCTEDNEPDTKQAGQFENGVFITNEGNFGAANASLSFFERASGTTTHNLFESLQGEALGDVVQSSHIADDKLYLVVNNSNKVEVLSIANSLEHAFTVSDLDYPRYMTSHEGKGYVTEWVGLSGPGRVTIFDLETGTIEKSVATGYGSEGIIVAANHLFVSNTFSNSVVAINLDSEEVVDTLTVGSSPAGMITDANGDVWLVCSGSYNENFEPLNDGSLVEIDPTDLTIKSEIELELNVSGSVAVSPDGRQVYFFSGTEIFSVNVTEQEPTPAVVVNEENAMNFYGLGVDEEGIIYAADAKGWQENGEVFRYNPDGTFISKFTVGIGPNGFSFY